MRDVTLVTRLITEELTSFSENEIRTYNPIDIPFPLSDTGDGDFVGKTIDTHLVPVITICQTGKDDLYFAYSKQVEKVLGIPISAIVRDLDRSRSLNDSYRIKMSSFNKSTNTFWKRLKFLFRRRLIE